MGTIIAIDYFSFLYPYREKSKKDTDLAKIQQEYSAKSSAGDY